VSGRDPTPEPARPAPALLLRFAVALVAINGLVAMHNVWPTFRVHFVAELSVETLLLLLAMALMTAWRGRLGRGARAGFTALALLLVLGRYLEITTSGLFGRPFDLYWDLPRVPDVLAMSTVGQPPWLVLLVGCGILLGLLLLTALLAWAVRALAAGLARPRLRRPAVAAATVLVGLYLAGIASERLLTERWFSIPVAKVYGTQLGRLADNLLHTPDWASPDTPPLPASDLAGLAGGDLFLIFLESYGATLFEDPGRAAAMAPDYAALAATLEASGWSAGSALYASPTFGGRSWLAHSSVISGARIEQQDSYLAFMLSGSDSLVGRFRAAGYRAVALVPGIRSVWPEGAGLGFDATYSASLLDYRGPVFGWWRLPDQFTLEQLARRELEARPRRPLFTFFPTIMSHMPFQPLPPYLADWRRAGDGDYRVEPLAPGELPELGPEALAEAYLETVRYDLAVLGGFLAERAPDDAFLMVLGDHQPPGLISGPGASWRVPVHVFAKDPGRLAPFLAAGFVAGLRPGPQELGGVEDLGRLLLRAFDGSGTS